MLNLNQERLDANETAFFTRELASIEARMYEVMFPERTILRILKIDSSDNPGAETYISRIYEQIGMAEFLAAYGAGDVPAVDVVGSELIGRFYTLANKFGFDIQEIRAASMANVPLEQFKAESAQLTHSQKWNQLVWFGDTLRNIPGILTQPNVPKGYSATVAGSTLWILANGIVNKTPDQINEDMSKCVRDIRTVTKNVETAKVLLMGIDRYEYIGSTYRATNSDRTILEAFEKARPNIVIESVPELDNVPFDPVTGDPANPALNCMVAFDNDPRVSVIKGPIPFEMSPPDVNGFRYSIEARSRIGGWVVRYPLAWNVQVGQ